MSRKQELATEIATLKQQLRERERERRVSYEVEPFGGEYCSDRY